MMPDIYRVTAIGKGALSVMAKPHSGEWIEEEFSGIRSWGIDQIVSLLEVTEAKELGLQDEASFANKNNMEFLSFPIPDRGLPESMDVYLAFTRQLYNDAVSGLNVVIHCRAGIGRTGIVAAGVLLHYGMEPGEAFALITSKRRVKVPDTQQQIEWVMRAHEKLSQ